MLSVLGCATKWATRFEQGVRKPPDARELPWLTERRGLSERPLARPFRIDRTCGRAARSPLSSEASSACSGPRLCSEPRSPLRCFRAPRSPCPWQPAGRPCTARRCRSSRPDRGRRRPDPGASRRGRVGWGYPPGPRQRNRRLERNRPPPGQPNAKLAACTTPLSVEREGQSHSRG
jgi:hypothetical protein